MYSSTLGIKINITTTFNGSTVSIPGEIRLAHEDSGDGVHAVLNVNIPQFEIQRLSTLMLPGVFNGPVPDMISKSGLQKLKPETIQAQKVSTVNPTPSGRWSKLVKDFDEVFPTSEGIPPELVPYIKKEVLVVLTTPDLSEEKIKEYIRDPLDIHDVMVIRAAYADAVKKVQPSASCPSCELGRVNRLYIGKMLKYVYDLEYIQLLLDAANALTRLLPDDIEYGIKTEELRDLSRRFNQEVRDHELANGGCTQCAMNSIKRKYTQLLTGIVVEKLKKAAH